jgi:hypothetical protein
MKRFWIFLILCFMPIGCISKTSSDWREQWPYKQQREWQQKAKLDWQQRHNLPPGNGCCE